MRVRKLLIGCTFPVALICSPAEANLITNGDFSQGNSSFSSDYRYTTSLDGSEGVYTVATNPALLHPGATQYGDHTTGTGNMLVANGATSPNRMVWEQTISVLADAEYVFSGWAASWGHYGDHYDVSPARLLVRANGVQLGDEFTVEQLNGTWTDFRYTIVTGDSTRITVSIFDANTAGAPNDFSLDDLGLEVVSAGATVPEPASLALLGIALAGLGATRRKKTI